MKFISILFSNAFALGVAAAPAETTNAQTFAFEAARAEYDASNPVSEADTDLSKRGAWGGVFYCRDDKWRGGCHYQWVEDGACHNVPWDWNDKISSFGPDSRVDWKNWGCDMFADGNCQGQRHLIFYPGSEMLSSWNFNDKISSIRCSRRMTAQGA
ncbi:hypothetical protein H2201_003680 [Coniosporium apollinis]|uniref:Beta/gamma crystallin 'Greek key' domain-containing protein n=1 Tax=Coniosporium apollinis TaxID=61459 RepID=A0ABQ9NYV9_9PEZI|nr:hypothetical protein H2201_003680 [Coniosporium apollinis]